MATGLFITKLGEAKILGTTKKLGQIYPNVTIRLYERLSGNKLHVADTSSDKNGVYKFLNLPSDREFYVVGIDPASQYNAVIQDKVIAK
ncbi:hypothetical protein BJN41_00465 [Acinetobacter towneri]|uniref:Carboxypeptidase regulatory-like domain-containing protein n=1 Tax=Acinetobacter towneri TaxID=202956 RepID=A0A1E8E6J0_9GAMM|nr:hypothetical protein BJN41_00465 [Acinetobacter towneri]